MCLCYSFHTFRFHFHCMLSYGCSDTACYLSRSLSPKSFTYFAFRLFHFRLHSNSQFTACCHYFSQTPNSTLINAQSLYFSSHFTILKLWKHGPCVTLLQTSSLSVHMNDSSDIHVIQFTCDKCLGLSDLNHRWLEQSAGAGRCKSRELSFPSSNGLPSLASAQ